jgi:ABC-type branched-subunit amino acid transport system substrate-binding protein
VIPGTAVGRAVKLLSLRSWLPGSACAAVAAALAGCTAAPSAPTTTGKSLNIYVSAPASLKGDPEAQDVIDAEVLGFSSGSTCSATPSPTVTLSSGFTAHLKEITGSTISDNARSAISDTNSAVAYLGEVVPGTSEDSVGITNAQDLLQVSPTDTAVELTQRSPAVPGSWGKFYQSLSTYGKTFARMVPTSSQEATFLVAQMRADGVHGLEVGHDGSHYGQAIAHAVTSSASGITASTASTADALFYGGNSESLARSALDEAAAANPAVKLFLPSALDNDAFIASLAPAAQQHLYVSAPGFSAKSLSPAGDAFVHQFTSACGHAPSAQAIFGYAAMQALVSVLRRAGSGVTNRSTVLHDFMSQRGTSVVGTYSISHGDITFTNGPPFILLRAESGRLVPTG